VVAGMSGRKKLSIILSLLAVAAAMVFIDDRFSTGAVPVNLNLLPVQIGEWKGRNYPLDERIMQILGTEYILDRDYTNNRGSHVYLSIVYYPDNKIGFHNPESCNTGEGSKIIKRDIHSIGSARIVLASENGFKVNRLILERTRGNKAIFYFFVSKNYVTHDYFKFRLHMMKQQMGFRRPSGAQVQIHSAIAPDLNGTMSEMEDFVRNLAPLLPDYLS
jgi:EpsI family protein